VFETLWSWEDQGFSQDARSNYGGEIIEDIVDPTNIVPAALQDAPLLPGPMRAMEAGVIEVPQENRLTPLWPKWHGWNDVILPSMPNDSMIRALHNAPICCCIQWLVCRGEPSAGT
jgi:hypothetical protein